MMGTQKLEDNRLCDFCSKETALIYCRADSAKLCLVCDREVHSTNQLFTKHTRWLLCDSCDLAPVSIFCHTDNSVLCQNCDWEAHKTSPTSSSIGLHDRRPLDGFTGQPSITELLGILGLDDLGKKGILIGNDGNKDGKSGVGKYGSDNSGGGGDGDFGILDLLAWDTPSIVSVDELIDCNNPTSAHNFQAMGVPPLPKNRNSVCGQHKEEILHQLRELTKLDAEFNDFEGCLDSFIEYQSDVPGPDCRFETKETCSQFETKEICSRNNDEPTLVPSYEASGFHWSNNGDEFKDEIFPSTLVSGHADTNYLVPQKDSDAGGSSNICGGQEGQSHHLVALEDIHPIPRVPREINTQERDSALSRYKEKKKSRRYEKQIRYESRKVRAETRTRIKGRFAKMGQRAPATQ
ncbi:hypothetical protein Leryth_004723 [Lithospermum erythrorhizon]|nr:hypothetical protein Leryth_004723 [Lithospermum erythrorhizon]